MCRIEDKLSYIEFFYFELVDGLVYRTKKDL
jgi:hypothetical protein